ncbi:alpha/beta hydrolase fold domain-containing protein [Nonomuraea sp. NN258]|nr:alpha/beta hydrolase fold domain-containing protein [Nonomuraea antri]
MELRHLRSFVAVADELNFGRAATRLYLSQPALSRQIRALERLVGCELLRRSTHRVELTLAGEAFLDRAREILAGLNDAVAVTRALGDEMAGRIARLMEPWTTMIGTAGLQELREKDEALLSEFSVPAEVDVRSVNAGGVPSLVLTPGPERPVTLLHLHGGGYALGSAYGYRAMTGALCVATGAAALLPEYRLAPEHPFPAAVDDAVRAYRWLLDRTADPAALTVLGDSSGGGLTMSLLATLRRQNLPFPGRVVLLSPWLDLTCRLLAEAGPSAVLTLCLECADHYLAGHPADDPLLDPLAADLSGYPPMLVQVSAGDPLVTDARRLAEHARAHGVDVELDLYPIDAHVFHHFWSFLPEAATALSRIGAFVSGARPPRAVNL